MSLTEIDLSKNAKDATLTPDKISVNPADNFTFPNNVIATGQLQTPSIADLAAVLAIDVTNRYLKDPTNIISLDWLNRLLKASDSSTVINFSAPTQIELLTTLDMTGNLIIHVADPVNANDATNKSYVDTVAQGLLTKAACTAATVMALPTVTPAGSGAGKTLTATVNGLLDIDGVSTWVDVVNDGGSTNPSAANPASRLLVKNQADPVDNGIYCVTDKGSVSTLFVLTRAIDFDGAPASEVKPGDFTFVGNGTVNASSGWTVTGTNDPVVVDTDPITFVQFSGAGQIIAGDGLVKTGNQLDVVPLDDSLTVHVGDISVNRDPAGAVGLTAAGIKVNVDGTYIGISTNNVTLLNPGSHTIAGTDTQVQFNNTGSFGASANFVWDYTNNRLGLGTPTPSELLQVAGNAQIDANTNSSTITTTNETITTGSGFSPSFSLTLTSSTVIGNGTPRYAGGLTLTTANITSAGAGGRIVGGDILLTTGQDSGFGAGNELGGSITLTSFTPSKGGNISLTGTGASNGKITAGGNMAIDGTTFNVDSVNHRVGVGTASPAQLLDVGAGNIRVGNSNTYTNGFGLRTAGIYDYVGTQAIDLQDKYLLGASTFTVAWSAELLAHNSGGWSVKWGDNNVGGVTTRILIDPNGTAALDWTNRLLGDATGTNGNYNIGSGVGQAKLSLNWTARLLVGSDGSTTQLNWNTPGTVQLTSAALDLNTHQIHNVVNPTTAQDAATKAYVDGGAHTVAGADRDIQFNNAGVFGASTKLKYTEGANNTVIIGYGNSNALQLASNNSGGDAGLDTGSAGFNISTSGGTWSFASTSTLTTPGAIDLNTHLIHNVVDPVDPQDAATKNYVDNNVILFVTREVPSGAINSSNTVFTLAFTPTVGSEEVFLNGLLQNAGGNDYNISGSTITFVLAPNTGSVLLVNYRH